MRYSLFLLKLITSVYNLHIEVFRRATIQLQQSKETNYLNWLLLIQSHSVWAELKN